MARKSILEFKKTFQDYGIIFIPFLAALLSHRLILQTDLIMVSHFGEFSTAAYGIAMKLGFIDTVVALSVGPVVSVIIAKSYNKEEESRHAANAIKTAVWLGLFLLVVSFICYPMLIRFVAPNAAIEKISQEATFWLILSIPVRFLSFIETMLMNGCKKGMKLLFVYFFSFFANIALDYLFMYTFKQKAIGSFQATFVISLFQCLYITLIAWKYFCLPSFNLFPSLNWVKSCLTKSAAEMGRLTTLYSASALFLYLAASDKQQTERLTAFVVSMEFLMFVLIGSVILMRTTAIIVASKEKDQEHDEDRKLLPIYKFFLILIFPVIVFLLVFGPELGVNLYNLSTKSLIWWNVYIILLAVTLPLYLLNAFQKGVWQAKQQYRQLFFIDSFAQLCVALPFVWYGFTINNPWICWSGFFGAEIFIALSLFQKEKLEIILPVKLVNAFEKNKMI